MSLLVNHTKSANTLYETNILLTAGNYKSANGQLQNNTVNGAMLIKIVWLCSYINCCERLPESSASNF